MTQATRAGSDAGVLISPGAESCSPWRAEPSHRRVRVRVGGEWIVDTARPLLMLERGLTPVYYLPKADVRMELLERSAKRTRCESKGEASYYTLRVGERVEESVAWSYEQPPPGLEPLADHLALYWPRVDQWFEEDDEVFVHARDPYKRVDTLHSSRHVRVELAGETVAETERPLLLFETGLPTRYYIPPQNVRRELLEPSDRHTQCPYKGVASYHSVRAGGELYRDIVWHYAFPIPEIPKIEGLFAFYNEKVDLHVDGELQGRPQTPFS